VDCEEVVLHRGLGRALIGLFSIDALDRLITIEGVGPPDLRVLVAAERLQRRQFYPLLELTTRHYSPTRVLAAFIHERASIKASNLQARDVRMKALFDRLGGRRAGVSGLAAFLSPPHGQATMPHADNHLNLVVQLEGRKRWWIWPRLPKSDIAVAQSTQQLEELFETAAHARPGEAFDLAPGDVLAVPTGFLHMAVTDAEASLSLSVQMEPIGAAGILERSSDVASLDDTYCRAPRV
jgi:hypothetical protein